MKFPFKPSSMWREVTELESTLNVDVSSLMVPSSPTHAQAGGTLTPILSDKQLFVFVSLTAGGGTTMK